MTGLVAAIPGWVVPSLLVALSVLALGLILERAYVLFWRPGLFSKMLEAQFLDIVERDRDAALDFARRVSHPSFGAAASLLELRTADQELAELHAERAARPFSRFLPSLGTVSTVAPLLGLLGTVTGMIKSFRALDRSGAANAALVGGIDEALITTALGLIIAIPALVAYNYFAARANEIAERTLTMCRRCLVRSS